MESRAGGGAPGTGRGGDGATDDTTPIQNALTAAAATGGIVYFPRGAYLFGSTLSPAAGVSMMGDGGGAPVFGVSAATILERTADVVGIQMLKAGTRVENIELTASTAGTTDGIWIGLETDTTTNGCCNGSLRNVSVHGVGGSGIFGKNGNVVRLDNVSSCNNGGWGLNVDSNTGNCEAWAITGLATHNNRRRTTSSPCTIRWDCLSHRPSMDRCSSEEVSRPPG